MPPRTVFDDVPLRAQARKGILAIVATLDPRAASDMLADLAYEFREQAEVKADAESNGHAPRGVIAEPTKPPAAPSPPRGAAASDERQVKLLDALARRPRASIDHLTEVVYGVVDAKRKGNLRALLSALKRKNKVRNIASGKWEVVE